MNRKKIINGDHLMLNNNLLIKKLSSINFALFIISAITVTSIAGTIVPQGESLTFYARLYGSKAAIILELLDITDMYSSYWFIGLLIVFCLNLFICTWVRLPGVISLIRKDGLTKSTKSITKDLAAEILVSKQSYDVSNVAIVSTAIKSFPVKASVTAEKECLFLYEKGAWSRVGAYIVHASIMLIICGAVVGKYWGYDAFVMIPEGTMKSSVHKMGDSHEEIPLGFEIFCQNFKTDYYPNGTPKEYISDLVVTESGERVLDKTITVNNPLKYKGITFFQSSYQPIKNEYKLIVTKNVSQDATKRFNETLYINPLSEFKSPDLGVTFEILSTSSDGHGHGPYKLQITDRESSFTRVMNDHELISFKSDDAVYSLRLAQRFSTGLKVVKDPGVWIVYCGCGLMLFGLYVSFFMSHIRIWILYQQDKDGSSVTVLGKTNKNTMKLDQLRGKILTALLHEEKLALRRA